MASSAELPATHAEYAVARGDAETGGSATRLSIVNSSPGLEPVRRVVESRRMCGIGGWIGDVSEREHHADRMLSALHHRGPDARAERFWDRACLVHTRLSIIDLSEAGNQPMPNEDGTIWTVFNGEIYNHAELQHWLESRGHVFRSRSDTEVIPHLYEEEGSEFVGRLHGMFAFAVLDLRKRSLLLARDRYGIKPLFYARVGGRDTAALAFASEINALRPLPKIDDRPDLQALSDFMALSYIPAPQTFFQGIRSLVPGEVLEASWGDESITYGTRRYHHWVIAPQLDMTMDQAVTEASSRLADAVGSQVESDVPLGTLLSGGIDSSLVSALAQEATPNTLRTFSAGFPDAAYDETPAALAVSEHIHSEHTVLEMDDSYARWDAICDLLSQAGQPFGDTSIFGVHAVARLTRKHVTVALSGDGGDEGFGGYDTFSRLGSASRFQSLPGGLQRGLALSSPLLNRLGLIRKGMTEAAGHLANADDASVLQYMLSWVRPREHLAICKEYDVLPVVRHFEPQWSHSPEPDASPVERLSALATEVYTRLILANDFLPKVDTASMKVSLEVRVPMLDEKLFEFGLMLPHRLKVKKAETKVVLRQIARRKLPPHVVDLPKHGFGVPMDTLLDSSTKQHMREALLDSGSRLSDFFRPDAYTPILEAFCDDKELPGVARTGLYQRAMMLLAVDVFMGSGPAAASIGSGIEAREIEVATV